MKLWKSTVARLAMAAAIAMAPAAYGNLGEEAPDSKDPNWVEGKRAIEARDWERATSLLSKAATADPKNPDIQNWLGYAQRKQGNLDAAFAAYNEALKLNPNHRAAHEYIGEAYLLKGDVAKAEEHLAELKRLCSPIPCEALKDLTRAVDEYKKKKQ